MKINKSSNFGSLNMHEYQVIISTELKGDELFDEDLEAIQQRFNGSVGEIVLRQYYLSRKIELLNNNGNLSGYILYISQDSFSDVDWQIIENDIVSVVEQIDAVLLPYK